MSQRNQLIIIAFIQYRQPWNSAPPQSPRLTMRCPSCSFPERRGFSCLGQQWCSRRNMDSSLSRKIRPRRFQRQGPVISRIVTNANYLTPTRQRPRAVKCRSRSIQANGTRFVPITPKQLQREPPTPHTHYESQFVGVINGFAGSSV